MVESRTDSAVSRFVTVAFAIPATLTTAVVLLILAWRADLPDPLAIHWGGGGGPDGFGSLTSVILVTLALGLGVPALITATTLPLLRSGARGANFRFMGSLAASFAMLSAVLNVWSVAMQRGVADAHDGPSVLPAVGAAFAAAVAAGVAAWSFQPRQATVVEGLQHGASLHLRDGERAVWMRTATTGRLASVLIASVIVATAGGALAMWQWGEGTAAWILLGTSALLFLTFAATTTFHVRVDEAGLSVVSALGVPRLHVALDDVADAGVAVVNGFAEFGGWGVRQRPGAMGVILRDGESLQVTRRNGKRLVVTVDDAATAAALLMALVRRSAAAPPREL